MTFGNKLSSLRKQANLTQADLAEKIGVSRQAITKWEKGIGLPDIDNMKKLSSLFNTSIDKLLDYKIETINFYPNSISEKIDKENSRLKNVDNFVLDKFNNASSIYRLIVEPAWGFWKSFFYTMFDIDVALMAHDLITNGLTHSFLVEQNDVQYLISINRSTLLTKKLSQPFNKNKLIIDGYKYTKTDSLK
jgi:transcriptional regulator with XRE-family HTH domain